MRNYIEPISRLINNFSKLPGVGNKTAARYAFYIINSSDSQAKEFSESITDVKNKVKLCPICGNYTDLSGTCSDCLKNSEADIICVVKEPKDVLAIEKARAFKGAYHVLHGTISPIQGRGPDDIRIKELLTRVKSGSIKEVIMATNPDVEGEATALYIAKLLKPFGIRVTRIAQGVSMGSDLEYADEVTLSRALEDRKEI